MRNTWEEMGRAKEGKYFYDLEKKLLHDMIHTKAQSAQEESLVSKDSKQPEISSVAAAFENIGGKAQAISEAVVDYMHRRFHLNQE